MGGKMIWFILLTYGAVVAAAFWVVNSENSNGLAAKRAAQEALASSEKLISKLEELKKKIEVDADRSDRSYKELIDSVLKVDSARSATEREFKQKLEWLEMKVQNTPKPPALPQKLVLSQDKPLQISVVYRRGAPVKAQPSTLGVDKKVMDGIKKKIEEIGR